MDKYKIITYKQDEKDVRCYMIDDQIFLPRKEIAKLLNKDISRINKEIKKLEQNELRCAKMHIMKKNVKLSVYSTDWVIELAKRFGDYSILNFQNWAKEAKKESVVLDGDQFKIVRFNQDNIDLNIKVDIPNRTIWVTQDQLAVIFGSSKSNISERIYDIYNDNELDFVATVRIFRIVQFENKRYVTREIKHYNLELVISLGFRINSKRAILFRRWANSVLKEYVTNGYTVDVYHESDLLNVTNKILTLDKRTEGLENRVDRLEQKALNSINEIIIKDGQFFDIMSLLQELCSTANERIILIDAYADAKALNIFKEKKNNVDALIVTSSQSKLSKTDVETFIAQYGAIAAIHSDEFHDRYLFIDDRAFHLGTSINYIGKKISQIDELNDHKTINYLLSRILN